MLNVPADFKPEKLWHTQFVKDHTQFFKYLTVGTYVENRFGVQEVKQSNQ